MWLASVLGKMMSPETATGLGSGVLSAWVYDTFIAPAAGLAPMSATVSPIIGGVLYAGWMYVTSWLPRRGESALERVKREVMRGNGG